MKFEAIYGSEEDIPVDIKENFTERNGQWELIVGGLKTEGDVQRLQDAARKEREDHDTTKSSLRELKTQFQTASDELDIFKTKGGKDDREPTNPELLKLRKLERENEAMIAKVTELGAANEKLVSAQSNSKIGTELRKAAKGLVRGDAIEDTVNSMLKDFTISDDSCLTRAELGANGGMTPKDFLSAYVKERSYLAPTSKSGGAHGSRSKGNANDGDGPQTTEEWLKSQGIK